MMFSLTAPLPQCWRNVPCSVRETPHLFPSRNVPLTEMCPTVSKPPAQCFLGFFDNLMPLAALFPRDHQGKHII